MVQVVATSDQAKLFAETDDCIEIVDANGKLLGTVVRPPSDNDVQIAKSRIAKSGKRHSTDEVVAHLRSLEQS